MSVNRLFIYDPDTNTAMCIARGYSTGWSMNGGREHSHLFFDRAEEFTGEIRSTRYELRTERDLPDDCDTLYKDVWSSTFLKGS